MYLRNKTTKLQQSTVKFFHFGQLFDTSLYTC